MKPRDGILNFNTKYHINYSFLAWASKFHTRKTLRKHLVVNKLSNIWKSQLIKLQFTNFSFIKLLRAFLFGRRSRSTSSPAHAMNCLFLSRVWLELFYTETQWHALYTFSENDSLTQWNNTDQLVKTAMINILSWNFADLFKVMTSCIRSNLDLIRSSQIDFIDQTLKAYSGL